MMMKVIKAIFILIMVLLPNCLLGIRVNTNISKVSKGVIWAKVVEFSINDQSICCLNVEYDGRMVLLESKWSDLDDLTQRSDKPLETIVVGKSYIFFIERVVSSADPFNSYPLTNSSNYFKVYNVVGDKLLPLSNSGVIENFNQEIAPLTGKVN